MHAPHSASHHEQQLVIHPEVERPRLPPGDLWVFAYGSLLWRPGFPFIDRQPARLLGYHRALCVWSHVHRGTPEQPGMVLGLDRGGSCRGALYRVAENDKTEVAEYLFAREMPTRIYRAAFCRVRGDATVPVSALTFLVNRKDAQYAGRIAPAEAARHVATATGLSGSSRDYLHNTLSHLEQLGIHDHHLQAIWHALPSRD